MNIGRAGELSGLPPKTIRYYEDAGLIAPARQSNGYRDYAEADVHKLGFLRRARRLGFSVEDCRRLLSLYEDKDRASGDVKRLAASHLDEIDARITELTELRKTLRVLVKSCSGDTRPDCPIIDTLAAE